MVRRWFLPLLLIATALFLIETGYADGVRDSWIGVAILCLAAGAVIWDVAGRSFGDRRVLVATGE